MTDHVFWSLQSPICPSDSFSNFSICRALTMISSGSSQYSHSRCPAWPSIYLCLCHRHAAVRHVRGELLNIPTCLSHSLFHNATGPWMWPPWWSCGYWVVGLPKTHAWSAPYIQPWAIAYIDILLPTLQKVAQFILTILLSGDVRSTAAGRCQQKKWSPLSPASVGTALT